MEISFLSTLFSNEISFLEFLKIVNTNLFSSSAIIIIFGALVYLIGKIRTSNHTLYTKEKEISYFGGIVEINNTLILPLIILTLFFIILHSNWKYIIFLVYLLYQGLLGERRASSVKRSREETWNYKKNNPKFEDRSFNSLKTLIKNNRVVLSEVLLGFVLMLFNLLLLSQFYPPLLFVIILWVDLTCLIYITQIASNLEINRLVKIKLKSGNILSNVRIIEYLNHLESIKIKDKEKVKIIPKREITVIEENL
jgi:hypothetical protein